MEGGSQIPTVQQSGRLKYPCEICGKELSRKQRLHGHMLAVHGLEDERPKRYKNYLRQEMSVPQRTLSRIKHDNNSIKCSGDVLQHRHTYSSVSHEPIAENLIGDTELEYTGSQTISETETRDDLPEEQQIEQANTVCSVPNPTDPVNETEIVNENSLMDITSLLCDVHVSSDSDAELSDYTIPSSESDSDNHFTDNSGTVSDDDTLLFKNERNTDLQEEKRLAILSYMLKFNLSGQASRDLTELIDKIAEENSALKGIALSKIKAAVETSEIQDRDFCEMCFSLFPVDDHVVQCIQPECNGLRYKGSVSDQHKKQRKSFFSCLPLGQQVKDILERKGVWECIQDHKKETKADITDITSGSLYKTLRENGNFLSHEENITLLFHTDGIPLYKSSGISIWPVYLVINELPPKLRFSKKNMILWGVWQAKGKPTFHTFLQPFLEEMQLLKNEGLTFVTNGNEIHMKAMLIAGTMDLQAKAYLVEMMQHNGQFGCVTCEHPGKVVQQGRGHARVYTPMDNPLRTTEGIIQNAKEAAESGKIVKGIKGVSPMFGLEWFDLVSGMGPDYMHGVILGVSKKLLQLLFTAPHSKKEFSLAASIKAVDRRIKRMKPTDNISRLPRPLENNIPHLKASELQNWLLFYSVPCLTGYMESKYLDHLALFVEGIFILLGDCITDIQMKRAESVLMTFYNQFPGLYGENNCTLNLHNACVHLPMYVKVFGPLWAWSCFPFENMNGSILNCVHGTGDVCHQILWVVQAQKRLAIDSGKYQ